ncbi:MAG: hypothetical protein OXG35_05045 [Acidobacteria bacterium]|nr:hypothetical protein [Acidobacteriota bacterium]
MNELSDGTCPARSADLDDFPSAFAGTDILMPAGDTLPLERP